MHNTDDVNILCVLDLQGAGRERSGSKQALAGCLASLSDMATTGMDVALPDIPPGMPKLVPGGAEAHGGGNISPRTFRRMSGQLRRAA